MKDEGFWALWQARVAANGAERMIARYDLKENLIFSKTYRNASGRNPAYLSMKWYYRKIRWVNTTKDICTPLLWGPEGHVTRAWQWMQRGSDAGAKAASGFCGLFRNVAERLERNGLAQPSLLPLWIHRKRI